MTVSFSGGIETLRKLILGLGRYASLAFEDDYMLVVERVTDEGEVIVRRLPFHGVLPAMST